MKRSNEKNFFETVRRALDREAEKDSRVAERDQRFWDRFEEEFGPASRKRSFFGDLSSPSLVRGLAMGAAAIVIVIAGVVFTRTGPERTGAVPDLQSANVLIESRDLLEDFELFVELDDVALSADDTEWSILVNGEGNEDANET